MELECQEKLEVERQQSQAQILLLTNQLQGQGLDAGQMREKAEVEEAARAEAESQLLKAQEGIQKWREKFMEIQEAFTRQTEKLSRFEQLE